MYTWDSNLKTTSQLPVTYTEQCREKQDVVMCSVTCAYIYSKGHIIIGIPAQASTQAGEAMHLYMEYYLFQNGAKFPAAQKRTLTHAACAKWSR